MEQWDTEEIGNIGPDLIDNEDTNWDTASFVPPVRTRTWYHTGAYVGGGRISRLFKDEYYRESDLSEGVPGLTDVQQDAMLLDDTVLPDTIWTADGNKVPYTPSPDEVREACRALKGSVLRQEIYADDGTDESDRPYSVSERNYTIEMVQKTGPDRHAVFFTHPRETVDFHYERKLFDVAGNKRADPRVSHTMTLAVDRFGNVLRSAAIGYGRRFDNPDAALAAADRTKQKQVHVTFTVSQFTGCIDSPDAYRTPRPRETTTFELLKVTPGANEPFVTNLFRFDELSELIDRASDGHHDIPYHDLYAGTARDEAPYRRLFEAGRSRYRSNDLERCLGPGVIESLAIPYENYKLAFTPGLVTQVYGDKATDAMFAEGGYVHSEGDDSWWIPSGKVFYSPGGDDTCAQELAFARRHFFLPQRFVNPFGNCTIVSYDSDDADPWKNHNLLLTGMRDPLGNTVSARNDYRVLQPACVTDPNGVVSEVLFDAIGLVVASAIHKGALGDSLLDVPADLTQKQVDDFRVDPYGQAAALLGTATTRIIYDVDRYAQSEDPGQPPFATTVERETHASDPVPPDGLKVRLKFSYSDGFGREIQVQNTGRARSRQRHPGSTTLGGQWLDNL